MRAQGAGLPEIAPGHWYEIPDSSPLASGLLGKAGTAPARGSPRGAARRLHPGTNWLFVWGGGHADYGGNEVYAFDLETLRWERLSDPAPTDRERTDSYADGSPRSRHTYDYLEFVPSAKRLISFGGAALYPSGSVSTRRISEFDRGSRRWVTGRRADVPAGGNMIGAHARL